MIRDQIQKFIQTKNFFDGSKKFVLLDEIDSMTKQAQKSLYKIIEKTTEDVCYILICNYFNKIIDRLKSLLIILSFRNTTQNGTNFIRKCCKNENITIKKDRITEIIESHRHDLRSVINAIQNNQHNDKTLNNKFFESF